MTYVLYLLGLHPEVQEKVVEELNSIFQGDTTRDVSREDLASMKYLECVIKVTDPHNHVLFLAYKRGSPFLHCI